MLEILRMVEMREGMQSQHHEVLFVPGGEKEKMKLPTGAVYGFWKGTAQLLRLIEDGSLFQNSISLIFTPD
jgi:hypothetical protein